jgi:transglutaminase-like putative cysteine protease
LTLTSNYKSTYQKAEAIFNYVNNYISFSFYYNTKNGAKKTIAKKTGNCVDKSHLTVALCRAVNIPARYVHGKCDFVTSGRRYGHVWTQILVKKTWIVADPSNNKLNRIGVIKSWNTNNYTLNGIYDEIKF